MYLRTSLKVGPFRCGISRSGLSVSTGVPGLRVGAGPRGAFVRVGAAGVHTFLTVPTPKTRGNGTTASTGSLSPTAHCGDAITMVPTAGAELADLAPTAPSAVVESLNAAAARYRLWPWVLAIGAVLTLVVSPFLLALVVPATLAALWRDQVRRTVVMFYEVTDSPFVRYSALLAAFKGVASAQRAWQTTARAALMTGHQRKVHAGAGAVVQRTGVARSLTGPPHLTANIAIPTLDAGTRCLYFLPDRVLVREGSRYVDLTYAELDASPGTHQFIEDGPVPSDATVIGETWRYVNRNGSPDRRFNNNRRLPIALYGEVVLSSPSGLHTRLSVSRISAAEPLAVAIAGMPSSMPADGLSGSRPIVDGCVEDVSAAPTTAQAPPAAVRSAPSTARPAIPAVPASGAEFVAVSSDGRVPIVGESFYQPALRRAAGGRTAEPAFESHIPARAVLVPEPRNPHDPNAVRVDLVTSSGLETAGYLARPVAARYQPGLLALGAGRLATCEARITGGGSGRFHGCYLHLGPPERAPRHTVATQTASRHRVSLPAEKACTVTGEERHQDHLRAVLDGRGGPVTTVAELGWCVIESGKHAGLPAIEVSIAGSRIGQLTRAMTERYAPQVEAVEASGRRPTAEAVLNDDARGIQVVLKMPRAVPAS